MLQEASTEDAIIHTEKTYSLSKRGAYNATCRDVWGPRSKQMAELWSIENPNAPINFRLAENNMLHDDITNFIRERISITATQHLTYSTGPQGSLRLRTAVAQFLNRDFQAFHPVTSDNVFMTAGVASAIDSVFWATCNEGDGIIIPRPMYNGFKYDIEHRSGAVIIEAGFRDVQGYSSLDDLFDPAINIKALECALTSANRQGVSVKAVMISNPHNPLGRCYPVECLKAIAKFCGDHRLHFVSDEIYARSVFQTREMLEPTPFTSTLAIDLTGLIHPTMHHVLYGASKDFCANGLRLGLICSRNVGLIQATSSNAIFSWSPHVLQDVWAAMLEDETWRIRFFAKNQKLMGERYDYATSVLRENHIKWFPSYAGVFLWIDLRAYLLDLTTGHPEVHEPSDFARLKAPSPGEEDYLEWEGKMADLCADHGVMIARGSIYSTEEYGWFRITFTAPATQLREGLQRLLAALQKMRILAEQRHHI